MSKYTDRIATISADALKAAKDPKSEQAKAQPRQTMHRSRINIVRDLDGLIEAVETALPDAQLNEAAIDGSWTFVEGRCPGLPERFGCKSVLYAVVEGSGVEQKRVEVWYNGKVLWVGTEPLFPVPTAEA